MEPGLRKLADAAPGGRAGSIRRLQGAGWENAGAHRSAVPTPVIDPRFVNGVGVLRAPSGFSLAARPEGQPRGACTPAL